MKDRTLWAFAIFAALVLLGIYLLRNKTGAPAASPAAVVTSPTTTAAGKTVAPATPVMQVVGPRGQPVAIADGKTIDLSSGTAVVRDDARSRAAMEESLKEMDEAARNVTFTPRQSAPPAEPKKSEPSPQPAPKP